MKAARIARYTLSVVLIVFVPHFDAADEASTKLPAPAAEAVPVRPFEPARMSEPASVSEAPATENSVLEARIDEAVRRYYEGRYEDAVALLEILAAEHPGSVEPRTELVRLLSETGAYDRAIIHLTALAELDPADPRRRSALVKLRYLSGEAAVPEDAASDQAEPPAAEDAESLFWEALGLKEAGDLDGAVGKLSRAAELVPFFPLVRFFLGETYLAAGRFAEAEEAFSAALAQEPNLTTAFYPLAQARIAQGKTESAHGLLMRARASLPWDERIRSALETLELDLPELPAKQEERKRAARLVAVPPTVVPVADRPEAIPTVRIGLAENLRELHLKTGGPYTITAAGSGAVTAGEAGAVLTVTADDSGLRVTADDGTELIRDGSGVTLAYEGAEFTTVLFDMEFGTGYFFAGYEDRAYRGTIRFERRGGGMTVINTVNLEEYLYATVPSEMPASWPQAALEAQAVAARTYTLLGLGRYEQRGFDLLGSVSSAFYQGAGREHTASTRAVAATRGMVLTAGGKLINAVYSANSGGHTESSESAWGFASALTAVPDPLAPAPAGLRSPEALARWLEDRPFTYSSNPSYSSRAAFRWRLVVPADEIVSKAGVQVGRIRRIVTRGRGTSGRVTAVEIVGTERTAVVKHDSIRSRLGGLRSNLFVVEPKLGPDGYPEFFVFTGGGWGHGVGMDQSGAAGMAAAGWSSDRILSHYYPGTELSRRY